MDHRGSYEIPIYLLQIVIIVTKISVQWEQLNRETDKRDIRFNRDEVLETNSYLIV